jgi:riboflavin synthase alpha subunit
MRLAEKLDWKGLSMGGHEVDGDVSREASVLETIKDGKKEHNVEENTIQQSSKVIPVHSTTVNGRMEVQLHSF